jgi:hypothetical protein
MGKKEVEEKTTKKRRGAGVGRRWSVTGGGGAGCVVGLVY